MTELRPMTVPIQATWWSMAVAALVCGRWMPNFYDWTSTNQTSAPWLLYTVAGALGGLNLVTWAIIAYRRWAQARSGAAASFASSYGIRHIMGLSVVAAFGVAVVTQNAMSLAFVFLAASIGYALWQTVVTDRRWTILCFLACLYLPYAWLVRYSEFDSDLWPLVPGLPMFFATFFATLNATREWLASISALLVGFEVLLAVPLAATGRGRFLLYAFSSMSLSLLGSLLLHALMRM